LIAWAGGEPMTLVLPSFVITVPSFLHTIRVGIPEIPKEENISKHIKAIKKIGGRKFFKAGDFFLLQMGFYS